MLRLQVSDPPSAVASYFCSAMVAVGIWPVSDSFGFLKSAEIKMPLDPPSKAPVKAWADDPRDAEGWHHILMASHEDVSIMWFLSLLLQSLSKFYIWTPWVCFCPPAWTNGILLFNLQTEALPIQLGRVSQQANENIPCNSRQTWYCSRPADSIVSHQGALCNQIQSLFLQL